VLDEHCREWAKPGTALSRFTTQPITSRCSGEHRAIGSDIGGLNGAECHNRNYFVINGKNRHEQSLLRTK
jgi:hypothetical protein